jgi:hypothetical protein
MKRQGIRATEVEIAVASHTGRAGWVVAKITYNPDDPRHRAQINAAIAGLMQARGESVADAARVATCGTGEEIAR